MITFDTNSDEKINDMKAVGILDIVDWRAKSMIFIHAAAIRNRILERRNSGRIGEKRETNSIIFEY